MFKLTIVGLGLAGGDLTERARAALTCGDRVLLRTGRVGATESLTAWNVPFETLDSLYEQSDDFSELTERLVAAVIERAEKGPLVYGVIDLRDESVAALLAAGLPATLIPGVPVDGALFAHLSAPYAAVAAAEIDDFQPEADMGTLVREIDGAPLACAAKLRLMERYPASHTVFFAADGQTVQSIPLYELDRQAFYDHRSCAYVPPEPALQALERYGLRELNRIMRILRGENGCPWDRAQTHESIRTNVVEEAWEVAEAIQKSDPFSLYDELGDLLLQITLHAEIARQHGEFTMDDVTTAVCEKMIARHEHIFGDAKASTPAEVLALWDSVKMRERNLTDRASQLRSISRALPALLRAEKVLKKSGGVEGFSDDLGGRLLALVGECLKAGVHPELALMDATDRLIDTLATEKK